MYYSYYMHVYTAKVCFAITLTRLKFSPDHTSGSGHQISGAMSGSAGRAEEHHLEKPVADTENSHAKHRRPSSAS